MLWELKHLLLPVLIPWICFKSRADQCDHNSKFSLDCSSIYWRRPVPSLPWKPARSSLSRHLVPAYLLLPLLSTLSAPHRQALSSRDFWISSLSALLPAPPLSRICSRPLLSQLFWSRSRVREPVAPPAISCPLPPLASPSLVSSLSLSPPPSLVADLTERETLYPYMLKPFFFFFNPYKLKPFFFFWVLIFSLIPNLGIQISLACKKGTWFLDLENCCTSLA